MFVAACYSGHRKSTQGERREFPSIFPSFPWQDCVCSGHHTWEVHLLKEALRVVLNHPNRKNEDQQL